MTLGEMIEDVCAPLGIDPAKETRIRGMVVRGLNGEYALVRGLLNWDWMRTAPEYAITGSTTTVVLPSSCRGVFAVSLVSNGAHLDWKRWDIDNWELGYERSAVGRGTPAQWDVFGGELVLMPYPVGTDKVKVYMLGGISDLVQNSDEPVFHADYHGILPAGAKLQMQVGDGYSETVLAYAKRQHDELLRAMLHTCAPVHPSLFYVPVIRGHAS